MLTACRKINKVRLTVQRHCQRQTTAHPPGRCRASHRVPTQASPYCLSSSSSLLSKQLSTAINTQACHTDLSQYDRMVKVDHHSCLRHGLANTLVYAETCARRERGREGDGGHDSGVVGAAHTTHTTHVPHTPHTPHMPSMSGNVSAAVEWCAACVISSGGLNFSELLSDRGR